MRLRELGLSSIEKRWLMGGLVAVFTCLRDTEETGPDPSQRCAVSEVLQDQKPQTKGNTGNCDSGVGIWGNDPGKIMRAVYCEAEGSPSLEVCRTWLDWL